ncbi:MAG TPA: ABC transporter ATP-binding protein [Stellaceae bacterium]|nr:ABC transporter ATP-binding protein [Stellaceae bacterium]
MALLEAAGIGLRFGGVAALADVSFAVEQGEVLGLIGPNGAGKTTMLNVISGVLPPSAGRVSFAGAIITGMRPHRIAKLGIARTFQIVQPFGQLTVRENVAIGAMFSRRRIPHRDEALARAQAALERVGLSARAEHSPRQLTLAERKQLELARALAMEPKLMLLDEVMAGLNQAEVGRIVALIREINQAGLTIIMVEHVMKAIMAACHRIVVLHFGRKIADDTPEGVVGNAEVIRAYLGDRFAERHRSRRGIDAPR